MAQDQFPITAAELSPARLEKYMRANGTLLPDVAVTSLRYDTIGHGKMGSNVRLHIGYSEPESGAPPSLVGKFPAEDPRAREMAGAQGAYHKEVMFYRHLAPGTAMRTPAIYASEISEDGLTFMLLMEDLAQAQVGNNLEGASLAQTRLAVREAAKLAASFYGDEAAVQCDYVVTPARDDGGALGQAFLEQCWPGFVDRFGGGLDAASLDFGSYYVSQHSRFVTRYQGPKTIIHGDFRSENILFEADSAITVDWQTAMESSALTDLAYFLGGSLETEARREWERDLVAFFREVLREQGVDLSWQACWEQYREYAMHGLLIMILGASFSSPDPRADQMFQVMIRRHLQQCLDLDAREFIA